MEACGGQVFEVLSVTRSGRSTGMGGHGEWGEISVLEGLSESCGLDPEGHGASGGFKQGNW